MSGMVRVWYSIVCRSARAGRAKTIFNLIAPHAHNKPLNLDPPVTTPRVKMHPNCEFRSTSLSALSVAHRLEVSGFQMVWLADYYTGRYIMRLQAY